ncbi:ubiquitin carboxyl-terminal hydrolase 20-like [Daphnia pulex]|uniref:ubiquitin carboxyl-terminal hydrolase 20-like n=1 Tax=Daphnia pulex TaxID=6669 RepID=UPI001EDD6A86|nr:ubiquitin carboxyl-terminal hydrolase 20-like [Daphnia pulex]
MEKKSYCDHAEQSSFSGLGELSSKANLNGVSKGLTRLTSLVTEDAHCQECQIPGRNLWLCLHSKCYLILCGETHKDHSSDHFQDYNNHCLHLNLTTFRIWCYKCEGEMLPLNNDPAISQNLLTLFSQENTSDQLMRLRCETQGIVGLQNLGNTCYLNAALQALSNVPPMTQYFLECMPSTDKDKEVKRTSLAKAYRTLIQNVWSEHPPSSIAPTSVLYAVKLVFQMFRGFQQHDSQEFLRCFMDQLHEELKEPVFDAQEPEGVSETNFSDEDSEQSESESYLTCDSGVSDDEGSSQSCSNATYHSGSRKRTRSSSDSEFSDALDRSPSPRNTSVEGTASSSIKFRSIVSDVFDGQILSSVECLTCNLISNRLETFQDLSLPIPSREQLLVIHQSVPQTQSQGEDQGWMSWMWNYVWGWFWGPNGRLNDCLSAFFSADELKGDNMYSCEKCKKLRNGIKFSMIEVLPEVLTIHLKRFRHEPLFSSKISSHISFPIRGLDMKPWLSRDCSSKITTYDLVAVIVHHGTAGGGHYTCYALNEPSSQWMEFDDSSARPVSVETVANCQAYVLFYQKRRTSEMEDFRRHIANLTQQELEARSNGGLLQFYISCKWFCKFKTFAEPGPIHNQDFLCPHGGIQPLKIERFDEVCLPVSAVVWEALHTRFGGGPACNRLFRCPICQQKQEVMDKRRREELDTFLELQRDFQNEKSSVPIYAIAMNWFRKWENFVKNRDSELPGPVENLPITILRNGNRILRPSSDFAQLSAALWHLFHSHYGGGPEVVIRS